MSFKVKAATRPYTTLKASLERFNMFQISLTATQKKLTNIYRIVELSSTREGKFHNFWHQVKLPDMERSRKKMTRNLSIEKDPKWTR